MVYEGERYKDGLSWRRSWYPTGATSIALTSILLANRKYSDFQIYKLNELDILKRTSSLNREEW